MSEKMKKDMPFTVKEYGRSGLRQQSGFVYEEFLTQLQWPQAAKVYQEMADNDPTIGAVLYMSEQLIRGSSWKIIPASEARKDIELAKFVETCLHDMEYSWESTIGEILSCFTYGFSFHEIVFKIRRGLHSKGALRSKHNDGRIGWRKIPIRSQQSLYGWHIADDGEILAMIQSPPPTFSNLTIPMDKGLLFRTKVLYNNPEGRSLLRNAYRPWYFKKKIEEIEGIGIERDLAGLPVLQPPETLDIWDTEDQQAIKYKAAAEQLVREVRRDQSDGVVLPAGWELKLLSTGGSRQFDTSAIINRYDQRIAITMLADLVMLGANSTGSFALAEVKKSLLASSLEAQLMMIADQFNMRAIPQLMQLNGFDCPNGYPRLKHGEIEVPDLKELGTFFRSTGMKIDDDYELTNFLRQIASLPELSEKQFKELQAKREKLRTQTTAATGVHTSQMEGARENGEDGEAHINQTPKNTKQEGDVK